MKNLKCKRCNNDFNLKVDINKNAIVCTNCKEEVIGVNEYKKITQ